MSTYSVGSLCIEPLGWPPEWAAFAEEVYFDGRPGRPTVQVSYEGEATGATPTVASTHVVGDAALELRAPPSLEGSFDGRTGRLRLRGPSAGPSSRLTLDNGIRLLLSAWLPLELGGLMFHGAAGVLDERGVVFAGVSTAGKSTLASGFAKTCYLSDDISIVEHTATRPRLMGAPFFGIHGRRGADKSADLAAIAVLSRGGARTDVERLAPAAAATALLRHVVSFSTDRAILAAALARVDELVRAVPVIAVARSLNDAADDVCAMVLERASC